MIFLNKPIGSTPLATIEHFRHNNPAFKEQTLSYAGRLDPMAEGLLLVLVGDENKKRHDYENLPKQYTFSFALGLATDSYDVLGLVTRHISTEVQLDQDRLTVIFDDMKRQTSQAYPPYSSGIVQGKPLYWWARANRLNEITIPQKPISILKLDLVSTDVWTREDLKRQILDSLKNVAGNFRQEEIKLSWQDFFETQALNRYQILTMNVECSSGTYVRSIVNDIGQKLGYGAMTLRIKREKIGDYSLEQAAKHQG